MKDAILLAEMLITEREQKIIDAILQNGPQTMQTLQDITATSRRTLYRDLQNLQDTLPQYGAFLVKGDTGYQLSGDLSAFQNDAQIIEWTQNSRNITELLLLIMDKDSLAEMMQRFSISQPTVTADLKIIEKNLVLNNAKIARERGLALVASEMTKRSLMVSALKKTLETLDILKMTAQSFNANKIIHLLPFEKFAIINQAFESEDMHGISDRTQALLRLFFTVSLIRIDAGYKLTSVEDGKPSKQAIEFVIRMVGRIGGNTFTLPEIMYLASISDSLYFEQNDNLLFDEKFDTDFMNKVRRLIAAVSEILNIDFGRDDSIFTLLNAHLRSILIIPQLFEDEKSTFIQSIKSDHERLFEAVAIALKKVFDKDFPLDEIAYVTLHFASTLERSGAVLPMRAALVTSRGRISAEFFVRKLKIQFPFIETIKIYQVSSLAQLNPEDYDLLFTTENLKGDYIHINLDFEISNFSQIAKEIRKIRAKMKPREQNKIDKLEYVNLQEFLRRSQQVLMDFNVQVIDNDTHFDRTIAQIIADIDWITAKDQVVELLNQRFKETPFGIPGTNIALVHGVNQAITKPYFAVIDLQQDLEVVGMDKEKVIVNRLLLLIAPKRIDEVTNMILGRITSSIVEYSLYTAIYRSGNYDIIYELLNKIINETLQNYGTN